MPTKKAVLGNPGMAENNLIKGSVPFITRGDMLTPSLSLHSPITVAVAANTFHPVFRFERGQMILDGILTFPQQLCHLAAGKVRIFT